MVSRREREVLRGGILGVGVGLGMGEGWGISWLREGGGVGAGADVVRWRVVRAEVMEGETEGARERLEGLGAGVEVSVSDSVSESEGET